MALVTHQLQGSYLTLSSRTLSWSKRLKLKEYQTKHHVVGRTDWHYIVKHNICLNVGPPCIRGPKIKPLKISAFKGNAQNDDSGVRASGSKIPKNSVRLKETEEATAESQKVHNVPVSYTSGANENAAISPAIHKLFKKWLTLLLIEPSNQVADEILGEPLPGNISETLKRSKNKEKGQVLKVAWSRFKGLNATVKFPILIFIPLYLAVNVIYGAEVSKELTPLWVFGPLIVALYIKLLRSLCTLYVFTFKQTVKVIKNLPTYYIVAYNYVARGKLKEDIGAHVLQPVLNIKNLNYKELTRTKLKALQEWLVEKNLDFVESIWPYYCRTIRFLKMANLI
ncbi:Embryo defective protein [Quillaja saponaria]|uniref:Embryo defective protein n=1 Tax=Quillaja saponaria TaxID=32244 RepID=A0AAD7KTP1_QUISA|nr:Embryo defective protein [Quillaja saponaria]KAJ7945844.1 Embryo defective protein [Quillaja saponaria]